MCGEVGQTQPDLIPSEFTAPGKLHVNELSQPVLRRASTGWGRRHPNLQEDEQC